MQGPLQALKDDPVGVAGIDLNNNCSQVEVIGGMGDCVIFNPMCLHSGSFNTRVQSRCEYTHRVGMGAVKTTCAEN
jgi:hypothetical protein